MLKKLSLISLLCLPTFGTCCCVDYYLDFTGCWERLFLFLLSKTGQSLAAFEGNRLLDTKTAFSILINSVKGTKSQRILSGLWTARILDDMSFVSKSVC